MSKFNKKSISTKVKTNKTSDLGKSKCHKNILAKQREEK